MPFARSYMSHGGFDDTAEAAKSCEVMLPDKKARGFVHAIQIERIANQPRITILENRRRLLIQDSIFIDPRDRVPPRIEIVLDELCLEDHDIGRKGRIEGAA